MKRSRYRADKIIAILKESEQGVKPIDLCRKYGMSEATFYNWKAKFGGMTVSEAKRLRSLEEENRHLKHIVADQSLDIRALKAVVSKNF